MEKNADKTTTVECGFRPPRTKEQAAPPVEPDCSFKPAKVPPSQGEEPMAVDEEPPIKTGKHN